MITLSEDAVAKLTASQTLDNYISAAYMKLLLFAVTTIITFGLSGYILYQLVAILIAYWSRASRRDKNI